MPAQANSSPHQEFSSLQWLGRGVGVSLVGIGAVIGLGPLLSVEASHAEDSLLADRVLAMDVEFGQSQQEGAALALVGLACVVAPRSSRPRQSC